MSSHIEDESLPPHLKRSSSLSSFFISPPPSPVDDESGEDRKGYDSGEQQIDKDIAQLTEKMGDLGTVARSEPEACVFVAR